MGIGRQQFLTVDLPALKAGTANRAALRRQVAGLVTAGQEWLAKFDAADSAAASDFAATKAAQFKTFTDALPDPVLAVVDPTDPPVVP
jgi:hypothetical protein